MGELLTFTRRPSLDPKSNQRIDLELALDEAREAYDQFAFQMDIESADDRRELLLLGDRMDAIRAQLR